MSVTQHMQPGIEQVEGGDPESQRRADLQILVDVPPTPDVLRGMVEARAEVEYLESVIGTIPVQARAAVEKRLRIAKEIVQKQERLGNLADRRDAEQKLRPDGCWCLGLGGVGERAVPDWEGGGAMVPDRCCDACSEGLAAQAEKDAIVGASERKRAVLRMQRLNAQAKVPSLYDNATLESFPITGNTARAVAALRKYIDQCAEIRGRSIMLTGEYGVGKTGLAVATMRQVADCHARDALFVSVPDYLEGVRSGYRKPSSVRLPYADDDGGMELAGETLSSLAKTVSLLVLDDIGAERVTDWVQEHLYMLINHRYSGQLRTIFTSNHGIMEIRDRLGDRIADRITAMADRITVDGENLRHRQ